jgi:hypothetical protein
MIGLVDPADKLSVPQGQTKALQYEGVAGTTRRKQPHTGIRRHTDAILTATKRRVADNVTGNMDENMVLARWMVNRHLDAVTRFYFDVDSRVPAEARKKILALFQWHGMARNFDAARRHSRDSGFRLFEKAKVFHGDSMMVKIGRQNSERYGALQLVEGNRITKPKDLPPRLKDVTDQGIQLDKWGGASAYIVCKYNDRGDTLVYDTRVLADQVIYGAYFERYSATRGVSPLLVAANMFMDIAESMEYQLLKIKLHALFGYAVTRELMDDTGADGLTSTSTAGNDVDEDADIPEARADAPQEVDFSQGPAALDLDPGEKIQLIESQTPPESVKDYTELAIRIALLALDMPFTFFDARKSSFAQVVADRKLYRESCMSKITANQASYAEYKDWKLNQWFEDGKFEGIDLGTTDLEELKSLVHVRPQPSEWLDKMNEIAFEERAIAIGLKSIPGLAREHNLDAYEILEQQAKYLDRARELNVPIFVGVPGARSERDAAIDNEIKKDEAEQAAIDADNSTGE